VDVYVETRARPVHARDGAVSTVEGV